MNYNTPQVGIAAVEVLEKAGYGVILANGQCCGRPMISKGMLEEAKARARFNVDLLTPYVRQGIPIIGCEPSCLLTLRDEYPDLLQNDASREVAANSYLIDEFLDKLREAGNLDLEFSDLSKRVLFHGHCHQKALVGTTASLNTLRLPPNYEVEEADSGCCGMAGSFGFEREHYDISMKVGKPRLFDVIAAAGDDVEIATAGTSCRHQIADATDRAARHWADVLADALPSPQNH